MQQVCCLHTSNFEFGNGYIILPVFIVVLFAQCNKSLCTKAARAGQIAAQWEACQPEWVAGFNSGQQGPGLQIHFFYRCYLITLVINSSSRGCAGCYSPNCQSPEKGQNTLTIILTKQIQFRTPQAEASFCYGQIFHHQVCRQFVVLPPLY